MAELFYTPAKDRYSGGMKYRRSGRSGIHLPEISVGLWHNFGGVDDYRNSVKMVHHAFDHGITHFDLANNYGPPYGSAEETFGKIMKESLGLFRSELFISTKAGYDMWPGPYGEWGSRKYLLNSLDQSLKRMNLDYVDIFYSHRFDPDTPLEETLQALVDAIRQGKALYAGISKYPPAAAKFSYEYLKARDVPCLLFQGLYNMLNRGDEKDGILKQAKESGTGYIAFSPLAQGLLSDRYLSGTVARGSRMSRNFFLRKEQLTPDLLSKLQELNALAIKRGQSLAAMALAWLLRNDEVTSVIVGVSSVKQLDLNLKAIENTSFSQSELNAIDHILDQNLKPET
jgi:L-glyceraldehyde 3-phosphate reductase